MQFSLRTMMLLLFAVAFVCAMLFSFPTWLTTIMLMLAFTVLPSLLVIMIVYGDIDQRTFGIGAVTAFGSVMTYTGGSILGLGSAPYVSLFSWILILVGVGVSGWVSVRFRRWLVLQQEDRS